MVILMQILSKVGQHQVRIDLLFQFLEKVLDLCAEIGIVAFAEFFDDDAFVQPGRESLDDTNPKKFAPT